MTDISVMYTTAASDLLVEAKIGGQGKLTLTNNVIYSLNIYNNNQTQSRKLI